MNKEKHPTVCELQLPNIGFYDSDWEAVIDNHIDSEIDRLEETGMPRNKAGELAYTHADYAGMRKAIATAYAELFAVLIKEELNLEKEPVLTYHAIYSPKEYNFTSDKISVTTDEMTARLLYDKLITREDVQKAIRYEGTPKDGYIPFYPPDHNDPEYMFENLEPPQWEAMLSPFFDKWMETDGVCQEIAAVAYDALEREDWFKYPEETQTPQEGPTESLTN